MFDQKREKIKIGKKKIFASCDRRAVWARTISSADIVRRNSTTSTGSLDKFPRYLAKLKPRSGRLWLVAQKLRIDPLCMIALWNNPEISNWNKLDSSRWNKLKKGKDWIVPFARGDMSKAWVKAAPALAPKIVTLSGSPPKLAIFFFTHSKAAIISFNPWFPGATLWPRFRNPSNTSKIKSIDWLIN